MASLYRRYRPQRFAEVRGQEHVTRALRNAVAGGTASHAYLFSGPRGTGKTSTARILAKALNCEKPDDGEPCGVCESCHAVQQGTSYDVIELDAASNNRVEDMRDLVSRAVLGTPGRWKVYIVDEVHMLSTAAANTLLKTLEEPPGHVVFVLATTDPHKVLQTIKSRTQHFEFRLLPAEIVRNLVSDVARDAGLELADDDLRIVAARGAGSARDALSALDQAAALGGAEAEAPVAWEVGEALADRDAGRALAAVAEGCAAGRDPRRLAEEVLAHLRNAFLTTMARHLVDATDDEAARLEEQARRLGPAATVRAMEVLGDVITEMREALDPRVTLEVGLIRITRPDADLSPAALLERIERLESGLAASPTTAAPAAAAPAPSPRRVASPPPTPRGAAPRSEAKAATPPAPTAVAKGGDLPSREELVKAWGDTVLGKLKPRAKALFSAGRFTSVQDGRAIYAFPNKVHRDQCELKRAEVEEVLAAHFGRPIPLKLIVEDASAAPAPVATGAGPTPEDDIVPEDLEEAPAGTVLTPEQRLREAFPGAEEVE